MTPSSEAQTSILLRRILERIPPSNRAWRIRVQKGAILVWWYCAAYLWLFADDHGLQDTRVAEAEGGGNGGIAGGQGHAAEGG